MLESNWQNFGQICVQNLSTYTRLYTVQTLVDSSWGPAKQLLFWLGVNESSRVVCSREMSIIHGTREKQFKCLYLKPDLFICAYIYVTERCKYVVMQRWTIYKFLSWIFLFNLINHSEEQIATQGCQVPRNKRPNIAISSFHKGQILKWGKKAN